MDAVSQVNLRPHFFLGCIPASSSTGLLNSPDSFLLGPLARQLLWLLELHAISGEAAAGNIRLHVC